MADYQQIKNTDSGDEGVLEKAKEEEEPGGQKKLLGYPVQVFFILGNEFCERFSYYGMHTILVIYLMSMLKMEKSDATIIYHAFNMLCYFSPIVGAVVADSLWGKYKTIFYFSIVYATGNIIVAVTAIPSVLNVVHLTGPMIGLILIGFGTGGIKPCVSTFGGDQFEPGDEEKMQSFFSIFYFSINFGSLISMIVTPILRADVKCFGYGCYPLGFGVPALLMVLSLVIFLAGTPLYKRVTPQGNVLVQVSCAVGSAMKNRLKGIRSGVKKDHWMDWASDEYSPLLKSDIKALFKVLFMFLPLPVFWTLFDQQGSRWVLQAMDMDGDVGVFGTIKPDQMQAANAIFVLVLIPFAQKVIYPVAGFCGLLKRPLQKMATGGMLVSLSFFIAGFLQVHMQRISTSEMKPTTGMANYRLVNTLPCDVTASGLSLGNVSITQEHSSRYFEVRPASFKELTINAHCPSETKIDKNIKINASKTYTNVISMSQQEIRIKSLVDDLTSLKRGYSRVRFIFIGDPSNQVTINLDSRLAINLTTASMPHYVTVKTTKEPSHIRAVDSNGGTALKTMRLYEGGVYSVIIQANTLGARLNIMGLVDVRPRTVSMLWQLPQFFVITLGEVMFSITGLEFAYSQSPQSMKSCIMAGWLFTNSVGNLIVVILTDLKLTDNLAVELVFFAILLCVVMIIFIILAYFYKYVDYGCVSVVTEEKEDAEEAPLLRDQDKSYKSTKED